MKAPFFSIVIPTRNRPQCLKLAIKSVLCQDFNDYEIIVTDNSLSADSKKICQSFKSKFICYYKNRNNLGFTRNFYKAIKLAKGKYIFSLGDDDLLLKTNVLTNVYRIIQKYRYGYIRLKFILHKNYKKLFSVYFNNELIQPISENKSDYEICKFIKETIFNFISGLVFLNPKNISIPLIETAKTSKFDRSDFWIKFLIESIKKGGGYVDYKDIILASWPDYEDPHFYDVVDNKIPSEIIWQLFFGNFKNEERKEWIMTETVRMRNLLFSIKYYSNNKNLFLYTKRLLQINPKLYFYPTLYIYFIAAFIMPKFFWDFLRNFYQNTKKIKDLNILRDFSLCKINVFGSSS